MNVGIIGLGRMGSAIAKRLLNAGHTVIGFDSNDLTKQAAISIGIATVDTVQDVAIKARVIWLMVPAGPIVDSVLLNLCEHLKPQDIIIDGGNSHFPDSMRRAQELSEKRITFLDCGTSGGIHGIENGFCLMIGGDKGAYLSVTPLWDAISVQDGYAYVGASGAGHYVKMVHNGIEYALMQSYAEGLHLLHDSAFGAGVLNLQEITRIWNQGSIIRSFLLELTGNIFAKDQSLIHTSGKVAQTGMGEWTVQEAHIRKIPVPSIELAVRTREWSQATGGNYATKIIALLRQQFGGHKVF